MEAEERPRKLLKITSNGTSSELDQGSISAEIDVLGDNGSSSERHGFESTPNMETLNGAASENSTDREAWMLSGEHEQNSDLPLSKNQLKKLKRQQDWEAGRAYRKVKRKEKLVLKRERKRAAKETEKGENQDASLVAGDIREQQQPGSRKQHHQRATQLPITFVFDCGFDDLMSDKERISLASQLTRCYSDNHRAPYRAHMVISSFNGKLRDRFEGLLANHHQSWRGVKFLDEDFVEAAQQAKDWMTGKEGGSIAGALNKSNGTPDDKNSSADDESEGEVIYLSSDSPDTLTELKPHSTYIIGGLVDKNRHKGICYKRAMDKGVKTAKLPIGDYMQMASRFVLATNHVAEIMVQWLELGDWGDAFARVVPKRKGGTLKAKSAENPDDMLEGSPKTHSTTAESNEIETKSLISP
ncbi:tRNA (guanine(9)-N(1))-methyltransferase [Acarospora aff. strigata]|nr:tRNA (guanine(9)-N(1))-methyltransferase [Acarospora aff. strigata]